MIGSELPKGWNKVKLLDIADLSTGKVDANHSTEDGLYPFFTCASEPMKSPDYSFDDESVIVPGNGANVGCVLYYNGKFQAYQRTYVLSNIKIVPKYLYYHFLRYWKERTENNQFGSATNYVKLINFANYIVDMPSLTEQKQIAEKLDKLFDQIETIKKASNRIPELLKNFRQQVLTYAVTGKLTERWRIENEIGYEFVSIEADKHRDYNYNIPETWKLLSFSNVVSIESNLVNPNDYKDYPLIAPDNIESMTGRILSKPTVAEIAPKSSKHYFTKDSLVYSKIRPYLSKIAYVDFDGLCSADMYPLKTKLNIFYLYYYMLSSEFLSFATTAGERIVLPKINQKSLNIIPVPVPSLKEQEEIVKRVQILFDILDDVERRYNTLCEKLDKLPQALLCKAFKGELL